LAASRPLEPMLPPLPSLLFRHHQKVHTTPLGTFLRALIREMSCISTKLSMDLSISYQHKNVIFLPSLFHAPSPLYFSASSCSSFNTNLHTPYTTPKPVNNGSRLPIYQATGFLRPRCAASPPRHAPKRPPRHALPPTPFLLLLLLLHVHLYVHIHLHHHAPEPLQCCRGLHPPNGCPRC